MIQVSPTEVDCQSTRRKKFFWLIMHMIMLIISGQLGLSIGGTWGSSRIALIVMGSMRILDVVGRGAGKVASTQVLATSYVRC